MKHLKTFEGLFKSFFKKTRSGSGLYYWTKEEIEEMEGIGFYRNSPSSTTSFHYDLQITNDIKEIQAEKIADVSKGYEDYFYTVIVTKNNNKEIVEYFDSFSDLLKFIKPLIPEEETDSRKYNL